MRPHKILPAVLGLCLIVSFTTPAFAGAFDWLQDLSVQAKADPSGFKASLATRFKIGDAEVSAVLGNVTDPADAYMVFRLGEMASKPPKEVLERYRANKGNGWGNLAKSLGIKPGSQDFKALKSGGDLKGKFETTAQSSGKGGDKGKGKEGKGKNPEKENGKKGK
ncbi:MAG: hypothetical protein SWC96_00880 [Thermodesulfobacteriota bacterium]|nr:hypothetical protein [Thermodesulfobacteriota bacterium]